MSLDNDGAPIAIHVPEPCAVRVRVIDRDSGRILTTPPGTATWHSVLRGWDSAIFLVSVVPDADGWYRFQAPPGRVHFTAEPEGFLPGDEEFDVSTGDNAFVVAARRESGIEVRLFDGEVQLPFPGDLNVDVVDRGGRSVRVGATEGRVGVRETGTVWLRVGPIDGYLPVPPINVEVVLGEWRTVNIALRRKS